MTNYKFQKDMVKRILKVGKSRIKFRLDMPSALEELKNATSRTKIRDLIKRNVIKIKDKKTTKRHIVPHQKIKSKKKLWIKKVRALRAHWRLYRDKYADISPSLQQKKSIELSGINIKNINTDYRRIHKKFCNSIYKLISQNKVKNRNYLCTKLGIKYAELHKKKR